MLDLPRMQRIRLHDAPRVQRFVGYTLLMPNYGFLPGVKIELENPERIPQRPVIFAMNHTDRYNYFPFQYVLWRQHKRFTATWVKGKYYESRFVGMFMELTNNIPTVSRGYLITRDFISTLHRRPPDEEYNALRKLVDAISRGEDADQPALVPRAIFDRPRSLLGYDFDPSRERYGSALDHVFRAMMRRFVELHEEAFEKNLDILVFPEGTRSIRLSQGRSGLAQVALRYKKTIVPVGCNGSDIAYPGGSPFARRAHIVYRIGDPIHYEDMKPYHVETPYEPFTVEAEQLYAAQFQGLVDIVMDRISGLLDERHRFSEDGESTGVKGSARFV